MTRNETINRLMVILRIFSPGSVPYRELQELITDLKSTEHRKRKRSLSKKIETYIESRVLPVYRNLNQRMNDQFDSLQESQEKYRRVFSHALEIHNKRISVLQQSQQSIDELQKQIDLLRKAINETCENVQRVNDGAISQIDNLDNRFKFHCQTAARMLSGLQDEIEAIKGDG